MLGDRYMLLIKRAALLALATLLLATPVSATNVKKGYCGTDSKVKRNKDCDNVSVGVGNDYTADDNAIGCWLLFSSNDENGAAADRCPANGSNTMVYAGTQPFTLAATEPAGTPALQDAVDFNNAEGFSLADDAAFEQASFTTGCWTLHNAAVNDTFISKGSADNYEMMITSTHAARFIVTGDNENSLNQSLDTWLHAVGRYDTAVKESQVYVNGLQACTDGCASSSDPTQNSAALFIGRAAGSNRYSGDLMECFYFDRALTNAEIAEIFLCGLDGTANGTDRDAAFGGATCSAIDTCCS